MRSLRVAGLGLLGLLLTTLPLRAQLAPVETLILSPEPGERVPQDAVLVAASFVDPAQRVDPASLRLEVDGRDVSAEADASGRGHHLDPAHTPGARTAPGDAHGKRPERSSPHALELGVQRGPSRRDACGRAAATPYGHRLHAAARLADVRGLVVLRVGTRRRPPARRGPDPAHVAERGRNPRRRLALLGPRPPERLRVVEWAAGKPLPV